MHDPEADVTHVEVVDLLWYDPALPATPPGRNLKGLGDPTLGTSFPGWGGLVASRSSWNDSDAVVVHGKSGREPIHEHLDDGQLVIHSGEVPLIIDLGSPSAYPPDFFAENRPRYYNGSVSGHNLMQIGDGELKIVPGCSYGLRSARSKGGVPVEKPREGVFLHTDFYEHGASWSIDLTGAYQDVVRVHRHVIHLLPDLVAVLDECELTHAESIILRWHTANRASIDDTGTFRVQATGPHGPVCLLGQICALSGFNATSRRDEHCYQPPYDRTRLDEPLEQGKENFVAAETTTSCCRLLTIFVVANPGVTLPA